MKTNIDHGSKNASHHDYRNESLSVKDAIIWFVITVVALCIAGTSQSQTAGVDVNSSPVTSTQNSSYAAPGTSGSAFSNDGSRHYQK